MSGTAPTIHEVDGRLVIEWHESRRESFEITAEAFASLIDRVNENRTIVAACEAATDAEDTYMRSPAGSIAGALAYDAWRRAIVTRRTLIQVRRGRAA